MDPRYDYTRRLRYTKRHHEPIHRAVVRLSSERKWKEIQGKQEKLISPYLFSNCNVLDAGCGVASLVEILPIDSIKYQGIDLNRDLIDECRLLYPKLQFDVIDLGLLPFIDDEFDVAICRGLAGVVTKTQGRAHWELIKQELVRVSKVTLLIPQFEISVVVL